MSKLKNLIAKIVDKKKGIKLADAVKYLEGKVAAGEIKGLEEVNFVLCKAAATELFAEGLIDIIEYKLPGDGERARMFMIPINSYVTYTEPEPMDPDTDTDADELGLGSMSAESELPHLPTIEVKTLLPVNMFTGFMIVGSDRAEFITEPDVAQATYMKMAEVEGASPSLFGAVPIQLEFTTLLDTIKTFQEVHAEEITTILPASTDPIALPEQAVVG